MKRLDSEQIDQLSVVVYPHQALRQAAKEIQQIDDQIKRLAAKMFELMYAHRGVGLAATQVGIPLRLFVANPTGQSDQEMIFINPQILDESGWTEAEEGCLSVPEVHASIVRRDKFVIEGLDLSGTKTVRPVQALLARICQHEMDHLDGRLILNRMSAVAKLSNRRQIHYLEQQAQSGKQTDAPKTHGPKDL